MSVIYGGRCLALPAVFFALCLSVLSLNTLAGETTTNMLFGEPYKGAQLVGDDQAQVIYYRAGGPHKGAANVYLDQELVTALQPGGYTSFCLRPGRHTLGAYFDEAPRYLGKSQELYGATLRGGMTYYLKVREEGGNLPLPIGKSAAEQELAMMRQQIHLLSRASQVETCRHYNFLEKPVMATKEYVLMADQLFSVPGRPGQVSESGRRSVGNILQQLQRDNAQVVRMDIEGHTDPMDIETHNQQLGQQWADAVRQALIDQGAPQALLKTSSVGSRELLKSGCYGSREAQLSCYAPNRRVMVRVEVRESMSN